MILSAGALCPCEVVEQMERGSACVIIGPAALEGTLTLPEKPRGLVVFAHGSGSNRLSPRNQYVARALEDRGFATLLLDLLTPEEAADSGNVFDIDLLGERMGDALGWVHGDSRTRHLPVGLFGASTGAAAALVAAARYPGTVHAVVLRGGRPDLASEALPCVRAATLLIVGSLDEVVITLNRHALKRLSCVKQIELVSGATHLFEEAGTLDAVVDLAAHWFERHLPSRCGVAAS